MLSSIYFLVNALESFLLAVYLLMVGSTPEESVFFNLSLFRLAAVAAAFMAGIFFLILAIRSTKNGSKCQSMIERFLQNEKKLWITFTGSIFVIALMMFLLTRHINVYGDLKLVYQQLEPVLVWITVISVQTGFYTAVWYSLFFVNKGNPKDLVESQKEIGCLFGIFFVFTALKLIFITSASYGPTGRGDEMTYFDMAESLYKGFFSIKQTHHYPPLYPLSLVITMVFKGWTFEGIKFINALLSSSIVFPIYLFSRQFLDQKKSLIVALLTCLIPYHLVFPRRIVSENLFFPLFIWAMYIAFSKPKNKNYHLCWDIMNGAMIGILYLIRYISLALIPSFLLVWWMKPFDGEKCLFRPGMKKTAYFIILVFAMTAVFSPWIFSAVHEGLPIKLALGFGVASRTTQEQLTFINLLIWIFIYVCYYFIIAAPVLNLLFSSLRNLEYKRWREGFTRLVFQVLVVMGGFFAAVVRHSWRAYYNRNIPSAIMGRYLIGFSAIFIMIGAIELDKFNKEKYKSLFGFLITNQILPFMIVVISYLAIIKGEISPMTSNLLKAHGSADGFMVETLGSFFYILIFAIYILINIFLWLKQGKTSQIVFVFGLIVYFVAGLPSYLDTLLDFQTYPWLAEQISELAPTVDIKSGDFEQISVFLPPNSTSQNRAEIYNGLRVRGIDNTIVEINTYGNISGIQTDEGFVIVKLANKESGLDDGMRIYEFDHEFFTIQPITR